jgi:hypothetical protein
MARAAFGAAHMREQQVASRGRAARAQERAVAAPRSGNMPLEPMMHRAPIEMANGMAKSVVGRSGSGSAWAVSRGTTGDSPWHGHDR